MSAGWIAVRAIVFSYRNGSGEDSVWIGQSFHLVPRLVKNSGGYEAELLAIKPLLAETASTRVPPSRTQPHCTRSSRGILSSGASHSGLALRGGLLEEP